MGVDVPGSNQSCDQGLWYVQTWEVLHQEFLPHQTLWAAALESQPAPPKTVVASDHTDDSGTDGCSTSAARVATYDPSIGAELDRMLDELITETVVFRSLAENGDIFEEFVIAQALHPFEPLSARLTPQAGAAVRQLRPSTSATRQTVYANPFQQCLVTLKGCICIGFYRKCEEMRNGGPFRQ